MKIINKDLLEFEGDYIVHQCNCVSKGSAGIAKRIFDTFPEVNIYKNRIQPNIPGTISFSLKQIPKPYKIINLFAQYYPGKPNTTSDSEILRLQWFRQGLFEISKLKPRSIAFPNKIGCNLGGGNWQKVLTIIEKFDCYVNKEFDTEVFICNYFPNEELKCQNQIQML